MRLILSLLFIGMLITGLACQKTATEQTTNKQTATSNTNSQKVVQTADHSDNIPRITLEEAKKDFDAQTAIFIDTRAETQYKQEHVKGAINIPMEAIETKYKEIPKGKKIIAYCS